MKNIKSIIIGILTGVIVVGGGYILLSNNTTELVEVTIPSDGKDGLRGYKGSTGDVGPQGIQGIQGIAGNDGKDAVINMNSLTDSVIKEIEDRQAQISYSFTDGAGNYSYNFVVDDLDEYVFTIRHFGSGDFDASIEDESGNVSVLIDSSGHLSYNETRTLEGGEYIIKVSATGNWEVEIEEK